MPSPFVAHRYPAKVRPCESSQRVRTVRRFSYLETQDTSSRARTGNILLLILQIVPAINTSPPRAFDGHGTTHHYDLSTPHVASGGIPLSLIYTQLSPGGAGRSEIYLAAYRTRTSFASPPASPSSSNCYHRYVLSRQHVDRATAGRAGSRDCWRRVVFSLRAHAICSCELYYMTCTSLSTH